MYAARFGQVPLGKLSFPRPQTNFGRVQVMSGPPTYNPSCQGEWFPDRNRDRLGDGMAVFVLVLVTVVYAIGAAVLLGALCLFTSCL